LNPGLLTNELGEEPKIAIREIHEKNRLSMINAQTGSIRNLFPAAQIGRRTFLFRSLAAATGLYFPFFGAGTANADTRNGNNRCAEPRIAIIIDDIGGNRSRAERFLEINAPLTFSILPRLQHTPELARTIHACGHEIMLHQPMEPFGRGIDPGPGALYIGDSSSRIDRVVQQNIDENPYAIGVNNHMGSRFTSSRREISDALVSVKASHLFFVDSLTAGSSRAFSVARNLGMISGCRNIFLDNTPTEEAILRQLAQLDRHARHVGPAIGIGHPFPQTANAIATFFRRMTSSPVSLVYVSDLLCGEPV
jgi:polysaccharide deacetylase 2 family uncharacterized protein YibQ